MTHFMKVLFLFVTLSLLMGFGSVERLFARKADLWPRWEMNDPASRKSIDHSAWNELLSRKVRKRIDGVNVLDYVGFSATDRTNLAHYIADLAGVSISQFNRDEQLAYWINLYNALTVQLILDHYPVDSIRDIKIPPGLFVIGPWNASLVSIEGENLTLNDIEHRILRPIWRDPRIHYVLSCASIGCPNLRDRAYPSSGMDKLLDQAALAYVNDPRGVSIINGKVSVSKIYDWFIADFGGSEKTVLRHIQQFAKPQLAARLLEIGKLSGAHYDWSVNSTGE
ncbi:MAG: DUF547 domain-containing protein [Paracoccaceae bacterium]